MCVCVCVCVSVYTHTHTHMHICIHGVYTHTHTRMHICIHVYIYIHVYTHSYMYRYIHTYNIFLTIFCKALQGSFDRTQGSFHRIYGILVFYHRCTRTRRFPFPSKRNGRCCWAITTTRLYRRCCSVRCSALQRVAARCSVLQRVAVCCSLLQCIQSFWELRRSQPNKRCCLGITAVRLNRSWTRVHVYGNITCICMQKYVLRVLFADLFTRVHMSYASYDYQAL